MIESLYTKLSRKNYQSNINLHIKNFIKREAKITEENLKNNFQIQKDDFITKKNKSKLIKNFIKLSFTREKIEFFLYKNEKQFNNYNIFADIILKLIEILAVYILYIFLQIEKF